MESAALELFTTALRDAIVLTLPIVIIVAAIGVLMGILQTIVQLNDQNIAFAPKLVAVAVAAAIGGGPAIAMLAALFEQVAGALPAIAR